MQASGRIGKRWVTRPAIIALCVLLCAAIWYLLALRKSPQPQANLMSIAFVGFSTNSAGQRCLRCRLRNDNAQEILALAELQNGRPGSGLFVRLTNSQPRTIDLPSPPTITPYRLQVLCFGADRGALTHIYQAVQHLRGQPAHEITKLLFTMPGPVVEP